MSLLFHRHLPVRTRTAVRALSITAPRSISLQLEKNDPEAVADTVPAYPYGRAQWYKQSDLGLYGGQRIQFGNNVGPKSKTKTRRTWHPNVFNKRLFSRALDRHIQLRVSTRALRTIDKLGGLDNYLLGDKEARIMELGMSGWWLRWAIMQTPEIRRKFKAERKALGLPAKRIDEIIREEMVGENVEDAHVDATAVQAIVPEGSEDIVLESLAEEPQKQQQTRLKFRTGRREHLLYTPTGWRRAKPDAELLYKASIRKTNIEYRNFYDKQHTIAFANFEQTVQDRRLSERQKMSLRRKLTNEVDRMAEVMVQQKWEEHAVRLATRKIISSEKITEMAEKGFKPPMTRAEAFRLRRRALKSSEVTDAAVLEMVGGMSAMDLNEANGDNSTEMERMRPKSNDQNETVTVL